ncbi:hypothetical protein BC941DRAFT_346659 [Chlamydoabsidia padenii]|nr:hypothetical protein BC941DRAFT_346659 [Chlamydoabsidia padenii]
MNRKKAKWYLIRELAKLAPDHGDRAIQLTFETKGNGHSEGDYMVEDRTNTCVGCNSQELLTMHHVVPDMYRRAMPLCIKSKSSRDILLLCKQCHHVYEDKATQLKKELAKQYDCPLEGKGWIHNVENRQARKAATALLRSAAKIPKERLEELVQVVKAYQQTHMTQVDDGGGNNNQEDHLAWLAVLEECSKLEDVYRGPDFIDHGTFVIRQIMAMEHITDNGKERWPHLELFIKTWRQHFLDHVKPNYLSTRWTVDGEIYNH